MTIQLLVEALRRALAEDAACSFAGYVGEGVSRDRQGRMCLTIQFPLTDEQVGTLRRRMPEVDLLQQIGRLS